MYAYAGVSVVNALPSWYGSTMAIDLKIRVDLWEGKCNNPSSILISTILDYFKENYGIEGICVNINSEIPQRSGLKSSSAVSVALIDSISRKYNIKLDVPKLAAILSLKANVSITGAYDDATAAYYGGISFTYNKEFKLLKMINPNKDFSIIILPKGDRPSNIQLKNLFKYRLLFEEIFNIAYSGDLITAAKLNGIAVAEILGYDTSIIREALKAGALVAGISGNGPSIFAIVKEGEEGKIYDIFSREGNVIITRAVEIDSERFSIKN